MTDLVLIFLEFGRIPLCFLYLIFVITLPFSLGVFSPAHPGETYCEDSARRVVDPWNRMISKDYDVSPLLNQIHFSITHQRGYALDSMGRIISGSYNYYIENESSNDILREGTETIRQVIQNGPWQPLMNCIQVILEETTDKTRAELIIKWGEPRAKHRIGEFQLGNPAIIVLNDSIPFRHIYLTQPDLSPAGRIIDANVAGWTWAAC